MKKNHSLSYLITVSEAHMLPAVMCIRTLQKKTKNEIVVVGNLSSANAKIMRSLGVRYIDEDDIDYKGRLPTVTWKSKHRAWGWYKQMFIRLSIDTFMKTDQVVILDSEVFVFDNWNEDRLYEQKTGFPRYFYWVPATRKSDWDYMMYRGAAYLLSFLPQCKGIMEYANSTQYNRHISGVVLFSTKNVAKLWAILEKNTDLKANMDKLFNKEQQLTFSDHDIYGLALEYGLFDDTVPTVLHNNLLGWYDGHRDDNFLRFKKHAMWSMCQAYSSYKQPEEYELYMKDMADLLSQKLPADQYAEVFHSLQKKYYKNHDEAITGKLNMKKTIKKVINKTLPSVKEARDRLRIIESDVHAIKDDIQDLKRGLLGHDARLDNLKDLLGKVEPYQPLYGLGGLISEPRRTSADRCRVIEKALGDVNGLRMLDIGSSLGYVSYYFADRGASVEGWDSTLNNVEVSRLTGELNGVQGASFKFKELNEEMVKTIPGGEFDVVFVLSVFHHIVYFQGLEKTKELVKSLLDRIPVMIVELAKKGEDASLKWDKAQPANELDIFEGLDVEIKKLGDFHNHLSDNTRPLYMVMRKKEVEVNGHKYAFETSSQHAYEDSKVAQMGVKRRYYFGLDTFVKEYSFDKASKVENIPQMMSEIALLLSLQKSKNPVHNLPQILDFEFSGKSAKLALKKIEGKLGSEYGKLTKAQLRFALKDILQTLADLEERHIHHNDIRSWNIMIGDNQAWLIDYGLASPVELEDNKISFLWTLQALMSGEREDQSQHKTKAPARDLFEKMAIGKVYDLALKSDASFRELLKAA